MYAIMKITPTLKSIALISDFFGAQDSGILSSIGASSEFSKGTDETTHPRSMPIKTSEYP